MALKKPAEQPWRILFHNSYPGLNGSQKMALQLLHGLPASTFEAWAGAPFATEFVGAAALPPGRKMSFDLPETFQSFRGGLLRRSPLRLAWQVLTRLVPFWWRVGRQLRAAGIDLVYVSNERCLFLIGVPARLAGLPVLWHLQSGFSKGRPWIHRAASRMATAVAAVSRAVHDDAQAYLRPGLQQQIRVIYNGLPELRKAPQVDTAARPDGFFRLTFIGALVPEKGLHLLLRAIALLPEQLQQRLRIQVAGEFREDWYRQIIDDLVSGLPVGTVNLLGYQTDVGALLAQTELLVVPSIEAETFELADGSRRSVRWKEGFNLVALEGLRAGVPVLAADTYGLREVVTEDAGWSFRLGDPDDLAARITALANDPAVLQQLSRQGRERFERLFTADRMQEQFMALFTELTSERG